MEVTTPASIAAAIEMGLKVDPNSYTESVTLLRRASLLPLMSLLGLKTGSDARSEEHTSELQSLMRISYAVFCLKKKKTKQKTLYSIDTTETNMHIKVNN